MSEYKGYYLVHPKVVADMTTQQLLEEIEEYNRREAATRGCGITTKELHRKRVCWDELYERTWGDIPYQPV